MCVGVGERERDRGRGVHIGYEMEGARWTGGGRVEVCALAVGERERCVHWLWMEGAREWEWEMDVEGLEGGLEGEGEQMREKGREGVVYGDEAVNGRILHTISLWNNSALHGQE